MAYGYYQVCPALAFPFRHGQPKNVPEQQLDLQPGS
jgi:hypothetical protein